MPVVSRLALLLAVVLAPLVARGQTPARRHLTAAQLDTIVVDHPYHCDYSSGKFRKYGTSGEDALQLLYLDLVPTNDSLRISGQLLEGGPGELFATTTTDTECDLDKIGETDAQGMFSVTIVADRARSLYVTAENYRDLEIKLRKLLRR